MSMETKDLLLRKAKPKDWEAMYRNVWSRPETARFMQWRITTSAADARARMERTIAWQRDHDTYLVYEKASGQAIGFAGVEEIAPHIYQDASIALGPEYVGKGYGKQILRLLLDYCANTLGGAEFYYSTQSANQASRALPAPVASLTTTPSKRQTCEAGSPMNWRSTGKSCRPVGRRLFHPLSLKNSKYRRRNLQTRDSSGGISYSICFPSMGPVYDPDPLRRQILGGLGNHGAGAGVLPVGTAAQVDHLGALLHQAVQLFLESLIDSSLAAVAAGKGSERHLLALIGGKGAGAVTQGAEAGGAGAPAVGLEAA